jgi:2-polyprenyl-3-methyl-5-hydroxy-6-metoxy-1,4-benzoquinol methylase
MDIQALPDSIVDNDPTNDIEICGRCLFCGSDRSRDDALCARDEFFRSDRGTFTILRCASCGSLWLKNQPVGQRLLNAYANYYTHGTDGEVGDTVSGLRGWIRASYFRSRLTHPVGLLDRLVAGTIALAAYDTSGLDKGLRFVPPPPAKILDYGCGNGKFLMRLQTLGYELHGAEYDPHLLGKLASAGIAIHHVATLKAKQWNRAFDHITLSHVLEHVPDPLALLRRLFGWLKPGGGLYLELPNADATGLDIFGRYWRGLEAPRHFSLPNRAALVTALERAGFEMQLQYIDRAARPSLWNESLAVSPEEKRPAMRQAMSEAPAETEINAELLTFLARRPA